MKMTGRFLIRAAILVPLITLHCPVVHADSLVTNDGRFIIGIVRKTDTGYTVETKDGVVTVKAADVRSILMDRPSVNTPNSSGTAKPGVSAPRAPKPNDAKTLSLLLQQGQNAISDQDYIAARNAFADALVIDPKNAIAGRGLGVAYLKLKKPEKAAAPLQIAATGVPMTRNLMLSLAASLVASHDAMDAAKVIQTYLEAHTELGTVDEPVLNALGIALWQVDPSAMHSPVFTDGVKLYSTLNAQLETTQPGKRRWGTEWLAAAEVTQRQQARRAAQIKVDQAWGLLQEANNQLQANQTALSTATKLPVKDPKREQLIADAGAQTEPLKEKQAAAQKEYDAADSALAQLPGPVFPSVIELADSDFPALPPGGDRHVTRYAVAFAIAPDVLVTSADAVDAASNIQITTFDGKNFKATVLRMHHGDGLALLEASGSKLPCLRVAAEFKAGTLNCMTYPDVDLVTPVARSIEVTAGAVTTDWAVQFGASPRIPGGPLLKNGSVVGVELGDRDSDLTAVPAATLQELRALVENEVLPTLIATDAKKAVVQVSADH